MSTTRHTALTFALALLIFVPQISTSAIGQCGGSVDFPTAPLPLSPGVTAHTESGGNAFVIETPTLTCYPTPAPIAGVSQIGVQGSESTVLFSSPTATMPGGAPSIDVIRGEQIFTRSMSGSFLHAAAGVCTPAAGSSIAISDAAIAVVTGDRFEEHLLPPGELPLSAATIGVCPQNGSFLLLCVETTLPSLEVVLGSEHVSIPLPSAGAALPDSYSSGAYGGVLFYTSTDVVNVSAGDVTTTPLPGTYVSHTATAGGVMVTTTSGSLLIPLPAGSVVLPFAPCDVPLDSAGPDATGSAIAMNTGACGGISGASATWPALAAICGSAPTFGFCAAPTISGLRAKVASVHAYASTTLGGTSVQNVNGQIWSPIPVGPGAPGTANVIVANALSGNLNADHAWAWAFARATLVSALPVPCIRITQGVAGGHGLVHNEGHKASWAARVRGPLRFEGWNDADDLDLVIEFSEDVFLPIDPTTHLLSETEYLFTMGSSLPGLPDLWHGTITATHDGIDPQLLVEFTSNPSLGLDDSAIALLIESAFLYDVVRAGFALLNPLTILSTSIDVPTGVTAVDVFCDTSIAGNHFETSYTGPPITTICGDGIIEGPEQCDQAGQTNCDPNCQLTPDETVLILDVPFQPGFHQLPIFLSNPVPSAQFSLALCAPGNDIVGLSLQGTITQQVNPELVLQQLYPGQGMTLQVVCDAFPPFDGLLLPPGPFEPIVFLDVFVNDPFTFQFCDDTLGQPGQPMVQNSVLNVGNFGEQLVFQNGFGLVTDVIVVGAPQAEFVRGDANADGQIDISDPIATLIFLFPPVPGGAFLPCLNAGDVNIDGQIDIGDPIGLLGYLFDPLAPPLPQPFPFCAPDPFLTGLECQVQAICP